MGEKDGNGLPLFLVPGSSFAGGGGREKELADTGVRENGSDAFRRRASRAMGEEQGRKGKKGK